MTYRVIITEKARAGHFLIGLKAELKFEEKIECLYLRQIGQILKDNRGKIK